MSRLFLITRLEKSGAGIVHSGLQNVHSCLSTRCNHGSLVLAVRASHSPVVALLRRRDQPRTRANLSASPASQSLLCSCIERRHCLCFFHCQEPRSEPPCYYHNKCHDAISLAYQTLCRKTNGHPFCTFLSCICSQVCCSPLRFLLVYQIIRTHFIDKVFYLFTSLDVPQTRVRLRYTRSKSPTQTSWCASRRYYQQ